MTPYYEDDLVQLYHGDCREVTAWLEADVLVTDPPYGTQFSAENPKGGYGRQQNAGLGPEGSAVTIRSTHGGWLVECNCGGLTRICGSRPSADRVAADHRAAHGRAREREG